MKPSLEERMREAGLIGEAGFSLEYPHEVLNAPWEIDEDDPNQMMLLEHYRLVNCIDVLEDVDLNKIVLQSIRISVEYSMLHFTFVDREGTDDRAVARVYIRKEQSGELGFGVHTIPLLYEHGSMDVWYVD